MVFLSDDLKIVAIDRICIRIFSKSGEIDKWNGQTQNLTANLRSY